MNAQERFSDLWTDYLEGELDETGIAELRELLAAHEDLLELAADMYQTHRLLGLAAEELPTRHDEFVRATLARLPEQRDRFIGRVMSEVASAGSEPATRTPAVNTTRSVAAALRSNAWAAIALTIIMILGFSFWPKSRTSIVNTESEVGIKRHVEPSSGDVRLASLSHAEFFGELSPLVGSVLTMGREYVLVNGLVEVAFPRGASVIIESPAAFRVISEECLALDTGRCSVHAPEGAEGFRVITPPTEITDLGTRFSVSVSEVGETDVQVIEGLAEVRETHDETVELVQLEERQARRFNGGVGERPGLLKFNAKDYRSALPDRVVSYQAKATDDGYVSELESVTVQRGGRVVTFPVGDLIGVKVIHFRAGTNNANVAVPVGYDGERLAGLESDSLLHTGLLNPGGSVEFLSENPVLAETGGSDSTPGLAVQFSSPVVNGPGPDVVFFELQAAVDPPNGDAFHVSPLRFDERLRSVSIRKYDIAMTSREARPLPRFDLYFFRQPAMTVEALATGVVDRRPQVLRFRALAVGIDLSDLGYATDETVNGLFFQDAKDDYHIVDPVFIGGLPTVE